MDMKTSFIFVFGLAAGGLAVTAKQPQDDDSLTVASSQPLEIKNIFIPEPLIRTISIISGAGKELPNKQPDGGSQANASSLTQEINTFIASLPKVARLVAPKDGSQANASSLTQEVNTFIAELPKVVRLLVPENGSKANASSLTQEINTFIAELPKVARQVVPEDGSRANASSLSQEINTFIAELPKVARLLVPENGSQANTSSLTQEINTFIAELPKVARLVVPEDGSRANASSLSQEINTFIPKLPKVARSVAPENGELIVKPPQDKELVKIAPSLQLKVNSIIPELPKGTVFIAPEDGKALLANEPLDTESPTFLSSPLDLNDTVISKSPIVTRSVAPEAGKELSVDSEWPCKIHNISSEAINDLERHLSKNGSEVVYALGMLGKGAEKDSDKDVVSSNFEMDLTNGEEASGVLRGERCLLTSPLLAPKPTGLLQSMLGRGLKGMSTEERLAEFRRRLEALRKKPPADSEKTEDHDRDSNNQLDTESKALLVLPVSPFSTKNLGEKFKEGIHEVKTERENEPFMNSNLGQSYNEYKEEPKIEKTNAVPASPVLHSAGGPSALTQSTGSSGIKLPAQFLSLTRMRERMVNLDAIPDDEIEKPVINGNHNTNVQPQKNVNVNLEPIPPLKLPKIPPIKISEVPSFFRSILSPQKIPSGDGVLQSSSTLSSPKSPVLVDQKESDDIVLESDECSSQSEKEESILEGIIAIPKYIRIK